MTQNVARVLVRSPIELVRAGEALGNAWFRGQGSDKWGIESTLERDALSFNVPRENLWEREHVMLDLFEKRMHLYNQEFQDQSSKSKFELFALIRHYGGPSRLLDVMNSYLVAAYFALSDSQPNRDAAIWAFRDWTIETGKPIDYDELFQSTSNPALNVADPERLNDRMHAQCGTFFVPGSVKSSLASQVESEFETNLLEEPTKYRSVKHIENNIHHKIWKLVIPRTAQSNIFRFISRCNVRAYSLFPGMDGLAVSLKEMMRAYD